MFFTILHSPTAIKRQKSQLGCYTVYVYMALSHTHARTDPHLSVSQIICLQISARLHLFLFTPFQCTVYYAKTHKVHHH